MKKRDQKDKDAPSKGKSKAKGAVKSVDGLLPDDIHQFSKTEDRCDYLVNLPAITTLTVQAGGSATPGLTDSVGLLEYQLPVGQSYAVPGGYDTDPRPAMVAFGSYEVDFKNLLSMDLYLNVYRPVAGMIDPTSVASLVNLGDRVLLEPGKSRKFTISSQLANTMKIDTTNKVWTQAVLYYQAARTDQLSEELYTENSEGDRTLLATADALAVSCVAKYVSEVGAQSEDTFFGVTYMSKYPVTSGMPLRMNKPSGFKKYHQSLPMAGKAQTVFDYDVSSEGRSLGVQPAATEGGSYLKLMVGGREDEEWKTFKKEAWQAYYLHLGASLGQVYIPPEGIVDQTWEWARNYIVNGMTMTTNAGIFKYEGQDIDAFVLWDITRDEPWRTTNAYSVPQGIPWGLESLQRRAILPPVGSIVVSPVTGSFSLKEADDPRVTFGTLIAAISFALEIIKLAKKVYDEFVNSSVSKEIMEGSVSTREDNAREVAEKAERSKVAGKTVAECKAGVKVSPEPKTARQSSARSE